MSAARSLPLPESTKHRWIELTAGVMNYPRRRWQTTSMAADFSTTVLFSQKQIPRSAKKFLEAQLRICILRETLYLVQLSGEILSPYQYTAEHSRLG